MFSIFQCFSQYFISQYFSIFLNISFQIFCFQSHLKDLYFFISTFPNFHVEHILSVYTTYLSSTIAVKLLLLCSKLLPILYLIECLFTITQYIWWLHYQNIWWLHFAILLLLWMPVFKFLNYSFCFIRNWRLLLGLFDALILIIFLYFVPLWHFNVHSFFMRAICNCLCMRLF